MNTDKLKELIDRIETYRYDYTMRTGDEPKDLTAYISKSFHIDLQIEMRAYAPGSMLDMKAHKFLTMKPTQLHGCKIYIVPDNQAHPAIKVVSSS